MADWLPLFRKPKALSEASSPEKWFTRIADRLLNGSRLTAGGRAHRLMEVELYYWSEEHPDPFTHRDPIQFSIGHWYFHRSRGTYRGGSFKGLDLTFGDPTASGGILLRGLETPEGVLIDGPSLCVDYLLDATGAANVADLDRAIGGRLAWDAGNPILLSSSDSENKRPMIRSPRVGLFLKKAGSRADATRFVMRPYRYLTEPGRTKKGKLHMVLALYSQGKNIDDIQQITKCPRRTIERYIGDFEEGKKEADFTPYFGIDLGPRQLCKLYGVWHAHWGQDNS